MKSKTIEKRFEMIRTAVAIAIALGIALVVIVLVSEDPANALYNFLIGPLTSFRRFANVIELAIPITFCGLAVGIMFSADQTNMAAEGGFYMSCATTSLAAILLDLPPVIHPIVCILIGTITGMAVVMIPAVLKVKWGANELVSSLMLNYICLYMATDRIGDIPAHSLAAGHCAGYAAAPGACVRGAGLRAVLADDVPYKAGL